MYKLLDVESQLRPGLAFMTMFFQLVLIGLMLLYLFRGRMPVSYRIWSAVNGMSLLIYNQIFYLDYEEEYSLKAMVAATNGPYFATYRINNISTIYILPTVTLAGIIAVLFPMLYLPYRALAQNPANEHESFW